MSDLLVKWGGGGRGGCGILRKGEDDFEMRRGVDTLLQTMLNWLSNNNY